MMSKTRGAAKPCAFCGTPMLKAAGTQPTKEHGFPLWVGDYLGGSPGAQVTHTVNDPVHGRIVREWNATTLAVVAKSVCRRCNTGWMNDLENLARPHLVPLLEGQFRVLDAPAQRIVAAWAIKTALALALANTGAVPIPVDHYRSLTAAKVKPPPKSHVWFASYRGWRSAFFDQWDLTATGSMTRAKGYAMTIVVARLVFHVLGHSHVDEMRIVKRGAWTRAATQIWPTLGLADWPPSIILDEAALDGFRRTWQG